MDGDPRACVSSVVMTKSETTICSPKIALRLARPLLVMQMRRCAQSRNGTLLREEYHCALRIV
jgi:hypothetical protein